MDYELKAVERDDYLRIEFVGERSLENGKEIIREISSILGSNGHKRVLLDFTMGTFLQTSVIYDFKEASMAASDPNADRVKLAAIFNPDQFGRYEFWENVAINRSLQIRMFTSDEEASSWLLEE